MPDIRSKKIRFQAIIDALLDDDADFPIFYFDAFSDIEPNNFNQLVSVWNLITPERKANLYENLELLHDADTLTDFSQMAELALSDPSAVVRASGIRMLDEYRDPAYISPLIEIMNKDLDVGVRAEAAYGLGSYVYMGEVEEINEQKYKKVVDELLRVLRSDELKLVRQKALESIAYSSHEAVPELISNAYNSGDSDWLMSSIKAMGRSADEHWEDQVLAMLVHPDINIQIEAVSAAGDLRIKHARNLLIKFALESDPEEDIWAESVWALSEIGGPKVRPVLEKLIDEAESDDVTEILQEALDNLFLTDNIESGFDLMDLEEPDESGLHEVDLEKQDFDLDDIHDKSWIDEMVEKLEESVTDEVDDDGEIRDDYDDEDDFDSYGDEYGDDEDLEGEDEDEDPQEDQGPDDEPYEWKVRRRQDPRGNSYEEPDDELED